MIACVAFLILSIYLWRYWYFITFYFKLTNCAMEKSWMVKSCNGEIKIRIGFFCFSLRLNLFICFIFQHNIFTEDKSIHNIQYLTTHNKYSNQVYVIKPSDHQKTRIYQGSADFFEDYCNSDLICLLQKFQAIHYYNQSVLAIVPDLNIFVFSITIVTLISRSALVLL